MATSEVVSYGGYSSEVVGGGLIGGCIGYSSAETAEAFPPQPLTLSLDQAAPAATATGTFNLSGTVTSSEAVSSLVLTINGGPGVAVPFAAGVFVVVVEGLSQGFNTVVITATDPDELVTAQLVVAYQPPAELRGAIVLDSIAEVVERMPWHLRSQQAR